MIIIKINLGVIVTILDLLSVHVFGSNESNQVNQP